MKVVEKSLMQERIIAINFNKYYNLYNKIKEKSETSCLPIEHVILSLLAIGVQIDKKE